MQRIDSGMTPTLPLGVTWRKSRHSNPSGDCVELATLADGRIALRNSQYPSGPTLIHTHAEMTAFIHGAKDGEFDDLASEGMGGGTA